MRLKRPLAIAVSCTILGALPADRAISQEESSARDELVTSIERAISRQSSLRSSRIGITIFDLDRGETLYEREADSGFKAASNAKIITASAALAMLGPEFRLRTEVLALAIEDSGDVEGDLYVRGKGNPSFGLDAMLELSREVAAAGVKEVKGQLVIDTSYFDEVDLPPHFDEQPDEHASFRAPIGATSLNFNSIAVTIRPAMTGSGPARVQMLPPQSYVEVKSTVTTVSRGRTRLKAEIETKEDSMVLSLSGQIREEAPPQRFRYRIDHPGLFFGSAFQKALADAGVTVRKAKLAFGSVPEEATLIAAHESPPMSVLVRGLGKYSNNYVAEMLLKVIGAEVVAAGEPATWEHGNGAVRDFMQTRIGLDPGQYRYGNGSGLFDSNELTPRQLVKVLVVAALDFRWGPDLVASLSIAGADGTLSTRLDETPAERHVRAKTGTLADTSALSGYAALDGRKRLAFSILVNDIPQWKVGDARRLQDDIALAMAAYLERR